MDRKTISAYEQLEMMYATFQLIENGSIKPTPNDLAEAIVDMEDAIKKMEQQIKLHPEYFI